MIKKYAFTPIKSSLEIWSGIQLEILRDIGEGLYIEYKKDALQAPDIAKQLAAFANESGGWLFFGIEEKGPERKAGTFSGINNKSISILTDRVRDVATQAIQPPVDFEYKVIEGPVPEIQLEKDSSILIIGIPQSFNTPHIYAGKIYRRVADKSEPKSETDHNIIQKLWQRRENARKNLEDFTSNLPLLSEQQKDNTWIHIYLITDLFLDENYSLKFHDFVKIMRPEFELEHGGMHMDNFFPTKDGFICRHVFKNNPAYFLLSFRWWNNGNARLSIPINIYDIDSNNEIIDSYKFFKEFIFLAKTQGFSNMRIGDFSYFFHVVVNLCNQYLEINKLIINDKPIQLRIIVSNSLRLSPFIDDKEFIDNSNNYGIPVIEDKDIYIPRKVDFDNLISYENLLTKPPEPKCLSLGFLILYFVLSSTGILHQFDSLTNFKSFFKKEENLDNQDSTNIEL